MTITEFEGLIVPEIKRSLETEASIQVSTVVKDNDVVLHILTIREPGRQISPMIYLESFYKSVYNDEKTITDVAYEIIDFYKKSIPDYDIDLGFIYDFDVAKENIMLRLLNRDANKCKLRDLPYIPFQDLAIVFYYSMKIDGADGSVTITNDILKRWNVSVDELYEIGKKNCREKLGITIVSMADFFCRQTGDESFSILADQDIFENVKIITNKAFRYGSTAMLFNDYLSEVACEMGKDLLIIPSSVHEIIVCPLCDSLDGEELANIIKDVNQSALSPVEVLSDHPYYYSRRYNAVS